MSTDTSSQPTPNRGLPVTSKKPQAQNKASRPKKTTSPSAGPHRLETPWSFWHCQKNKNNSAFESGLTRLGTCSTVEEFWGFYSHIKRPHELPNDTNIHLFRRTVSPMWEQFPNGGSWVVRLKKHSPLLARMWEELLIATIGEVFEEPDLVGVVLRIRKKEDSLVLWNKDQNLRYRIGEKLKQILVLPANCPGMEYQTNRSNMLLDQRYSGGSKPQTNAEGKLEG